jgi:type I restriction enzyme S subunit
MAFEISELIQTGNLPEGWSVCKVSDVADVNSASISKRNPPNEIAYLDISSVSTRSYEKPRRMKFADAPSRAQRIVKAGDTLIATVRPNLRAFVYVDRPEKNLIASTGFACVTPKKRGDSRFLHYFLTCEPFIEYLVRLADGAAYPAFDYKLIPLAEMPLPPVSEREEIGDILGAIDDRITLLRETNATLEAIAQAIFKSWFVDFDPVRAKQEGRAPGGMDEATAALFPDSFEESALGLVPRGWSLSTLSDLVTFQNGYAFKSKDWTETGHPVVKIGNVRPGVIEFAGCSYVSKNTVVGLERFRLSRGDLLVGMTGYVGETGLVPDVEPVAYLNQRVGRISTKSGVADLGYVYCAVRSPAFKEFSVAQSHGSAQENVSGSALMGFPVMIVSSALVDRFNGLIAGMLERILENHKQAENLSTLRDTLLPRLISGQLRLPDAEDAIAEVVE